MRKPMVLKSASIALAVVLCATNAAAQDEPNAADVSAARGLGQEGVKLADAGNCEEAIEKLTRAEKLFHAPTTLAKLGECQVKVGKIVIGTENLNRVSREALPANAPQAFRDAQDRAKQVLAEAKPKIAKLKIAVAAPADAKMTVTIDGENIPLANLNTNRPVDPGEHVIEVTAPGFLKSTGKVRLPEGGIDSIALTLEPDPNAPKTPVVVAPVGGTDTQPTPPPGDRTTPGRDKTAAYVTLGIGGAGIVVGTIFGLVAIGKKGDLNDACPNKVCPSAAQQDTIDSGKTMGTVSTVGFIVGGLGLAVGTVLLFTGGSSPAKADLKPKVQPTIGAGQVGLAGTF